MYSNFFQMQNIVIGNVTFSSPAAHVFVNKRNLENTYTIRCLQNIRSVVTRPWEKRLIIVSNQQWFSRKKIVPKG